MKLFVQRLVFGLCLTPVVAGAASVDEFYLVRLRAGRDAYRSKRYPEAADELRIACFGFLDQAPLLMEALARLALAQNAAGRRLDLNATLDRFYDLEQRQSLYEKASLEAETRAEFEALLRARFVPDQLRAVPSLARLVEAAPKPSLESLPPSQRKAALLELEKKDRGNPAWPLELARLAAAEGDHKEVVRLASRVLDLDAGEGDALELRAHAHVARKECAEAVLDFKALPAERLEANGPARADRFVCEIASKEWDAARATFGGLPEELKARADVARAFKRLPSAPQAAAPQPPSPPPTPVEAVEPAAIAAALKLAEEGKAADATERLKKLAARAPANRELRKALLEAACLSKEWKTAADQVPSVEPFKDGEETSMFYAAVSLYQTGAAEAAKVLMARARPKIGSNPFVDHYAKKILGTS